MTQEYRYRALIKGSVNQAVFAAQQRKFTVLQILRQGDDKTPTLLLVQAERERAIGDWMIEGPPSPPFPPGTLLFYSDEETGKEKKKAWIAKHGWEMDDDLDGLGTQLDLLAEYELGDAVIQIWGGGRYYSYRFEIYKLVDGKPKTVLGEGVAENTKEDAARVAVLRGIREGYLTGLHMDKLRDAIREGNRSPGWSMDPDLDGLDNNRPFTRLFKLLVTGKPGSAEREARRRGFMVQDVVVATQPHVKDIECMLTVSAAADMKSSEAETILRNWLNEGYGPAGSLRWFGDASTPVPIQKGWNMDPDLDGLLIGYVLYVKGPVGPAIQEAQNRGFRVESFGYHFQHDITELVVRVADEAELNAWLAETLNTDDKPVQSLLAYEEIEVTELNGLHAFHPWSVSTLTPGLHGKPVYRYFDDFAAAVDYARDRVRKGKRLREGGKAYFILGHTADPDGAVAYRVFRTFTAGREKGAQHYTEKKEFVLVQEHGGSLPGNKTRWVTNRALSVEILDAETEKARKKPMPYERTRKSVFFPRTDAEAAKPFLRGDPDDRAVFRLAQLKEQGVNAKIVRRKDGSIAIRLPDGTIEDV